MIKKMLAMLAVVSCAFGAWADATHISGTDFSTHGTGDFITGRDDSGAATESTYWYNGNTNDFSGTIVLGTNGTDHVLDFESNITNPVYRTIEGCYGRTVANFEPHAVGGGLFVDTYVAFTPYLVNNDHAAPTKVTPQDKIMVWVRETEVEEGANITNLIVTAGYYDAQSSFTASNYVANLESAQVSALCNGGLQRLTIKSFANITTYTGFYLMGFVVYINETPVSYTADAFEEGCPFAALDAGPRRYYEPTHMLFPSLAGYSNNSADSTLTSVGYAGVGQVGNIYFDDYSTSYPSFAGDDLDFDVVMGDGVTEYVYDNVTYNTNATFTVLPSTETITISGVQYDTVNGWKHKTGTWHNGTNVVNNAEGVGGDTGTFTLFPDALTLTLAGFKANYLVFDGVTTNEYQTLLGNGGALAAALSAGNLILNSDILLNEGTGDFAGCILIEEGTLTIDLNGHTIKGTGLATIINLLGTLTINDSSAGQTGKVLNSDAGSTGMWLAGGTTTLNAGTFETILPDGGALVINGGAYLQDAHTPDADDFYLKAYAQGKEITWDLVSGHYYATVGGSAPVTTYAVTFSTNTVVVAEYTTNIAAGATLPADAIPAFTGGAWDLDPTNAVINAATNFNYTIVASYTLTYASDHGVVPDGVIYTASTPDFALAAAPTADGWQFGGWLIGSDVFEAGDTYVVAEHLENTTATAVWTPVTYTLTYTTEHGDAPAAVSYTVESNNFALAAAPDPGVVSVEFVGWVIGVTTNNAGATYVVADHLANTTATAAWAALVPPAKFPQSDTAGTEYAGRDGTPALPFVIRNYDDLVLLKNAVADGEITTQSFEVVSNITGVTDWVGIGTSSSVAFAGTLNGNGKTINVTFAAGTKYNGLFAYVNNATLSNLTVNVTAGSVSDETAGAAFVGKAYGSCTFETLKATGSLGTELAPVNHNTAGICAQVNGSGTMNFNYCTNAMNIYASYKKVGGIVATRELYDTAQINFNNCVNSGNINNSYGQLEECYGTGGLMGWTGYANPAKIAIANCSNTGNIVSPNMYLGNFLGYENAQPTASGTNIGLASLKPSGSSYIDGLNWATVDGDLATFVTPVANVGETVTYKLMQSGGAADGFTLTADDASLTILTNFYGYTGTVTVDPTLTAQGYELVETPDVNGVTFTCAIPTPTDPWEPEGGDHSDTAVSNKVADIFGDAVAQKINTYDDYTNMVAYIKSVTSSSEAPTDLTTAQAAHAYQSYMLGAAVLFTEDPVISITSVAASSTAGEWDFTVVVTTETDSPTALQVAADKVKALVKVRNSLTTGDWAAPAAADVSAEQLLGGNAIKVTVDYGEAGSGFMKISD